jgi:hypothetical protein
MHSKTWSCPFFITRSCCIIISLSHPFTILLSNK